MIKQFKGKEQKDIVSPFTYCPVIELGKKQDSITPNLNELVNNPVTVKDNEEHVLNYLGECITFKIKNELLVATADIVLAFQNIAGVELDNESIMDILENSDLFKAALITNIDNSRIEEFIRLNKYQLISAIYTEAASVSLCEDPSFTTFNTTTIDAIYDNLSRAAHYTDNCIMRAIDNIIVYIKTQF